MLRLLNECGHAVRRAGYPGSKLLRQLAFGMLAPAFQSELPAYGFAPLPSTVCTLAQY
jgi:hypothetical protein